jgi:hypothetical protein
MERDERQGIAGQEGGGAGPIQGEGDYRSAREYREQVREYLEHADVEKAARAAAPRTAEEARELEEAEEAGRSRGRAGFRRGRATAGSLGQAVSGRPLAAMVVAGTVGYLLARGLHRRHDET